MKNKKWKIIAPSLMVITTIPLASLSGCACHNPAIIEPTFFQKGTGSMNDVTTAVITIDWTPSGDSITISDPSFSCTTGETESIEIKSEETGRPCIFEIKFKNDIKTNITDGVLNFHYIDETADIEDDAAISEIKISKFPYDISISNKDKNGYITSIDKPYFEYNLSFEGLVEGDIISSEITESTKHKTKINPDWLKHTITAEDVKAKKIMLKVEPVSDDPDQFVFSDVMSIKFQFKHNDEICYDKTISGFVLDTALPTQPEYFTYDVNDPTILTGFDLVNHKQDLLNCGVLFVPEHVTKIADDAFNISKHSDYTQLFNSYLKWLLLDKSFIGDCALKTIGNNAFNGCNFYETLYIPSTIETIGTNAFRSCAFDHFEYLGNKESELKTIGTGAFAGCNHLSGTLSIPNAQSFTTLETEVFGEANSPETGKKVEKLIISENIQIFKRHCINRFGSELKVLDLSDYDTVPEAKNIAEYSFWNLPQSGIIYINNESLRSAWQTVLSQKNVFEYFDKWTIEVKETNQK